MTLTRRPIRFSVILAGLCVLCTGGAAQTIPGDQEVAPVAEHGSRDGTTLQTRLANGFGIVARVHGAGSGKVTLWLRVEAGSAYEKPSERGAAHLAEHLALTGPEPEQPGYQAVADLGVPIGENRNGYTNTDHTAYWIVTDGSSEELDRALLALATILNPQPTSEKSLDREREIVLDEWASSVSPRAIAQRKLLAGLFPGTALDERWPAVEPETLALLSPERVDGFRARAYTVSAASLVVVGPIDAEVITKKAAEVFGRLEAKEPARLVAGGLLADGDRVVRAEQSGLTETEITIAWPGRTNLEKRTIDTLAVTILRERVKRLTSETEGWAGKNLVVMDIALPAAAEVHAGRESEQLRLVQIAATFPPGAASAGLATLGSAVWEMAQRPISPQELQAGIETLESSYAWGVENEGAVSPTKLASLIASALPREILPTKAERLASVRAELAQVDAGRVTAAARALFAADRAVLLAQGPAGKLPSSQVLLDDYAHGAALLPEIDRSSVVGETGSDARFFLEPPLRGRLDRVSLDQRAGVFDAVLENGVQVRHREMPTPDGGVILRVSLARAISTEKPEQAGLTLAAAEALAHRPATKASPGNELSVFLERREMKLSVFDVDGTIDFELQAPSASLEEGARFLAALLVEPSIDQSDLRWWRTRAQAVYDETWADPALLALRLLETRLLDAEVFKSPERALSSEDHRKARAEYFDRLRSFTGERAEARIVEAAASGQVIVTLVGECSQERAIDAAVGAFSALPKRSQHRVVLGERADGEVFERVQSTEPGGVGAAVIARMVPRTLSIDRVRQLVTAAQILDGRLSEVDGLESLGEHYPRATIAYSAAHPGRVSLVLMFSGEPSELEMLTERVNGVVETFASQGPTAQELEDAREKMVKVASQALLSAGLWSYRLSIDAQADQPLDGLLSMSRDYAAVTAAECRERVGDALSGGQITIEAVPSGDHTEP